MDILIKYYIVGLVLLFILETLYFKIKRVKPDVTFVVFSTVFYPISIVLLLFLVIMYILTELLKKVWS
jgi:hypothetical protein